MKKFLEAILGENKVLEVGDFVLLLEPANPPHHLQTGIRVCTKEEFKFKLKYDGNKTEKNREALSNIQHDKNLKDWHPSPIHLKEEIVDGKKYLVGDF